MSFEKKRFEPRKWKGIPQEELAIGKDERNEAMPSVETAKKIADVFKVTLDFLVDDSAVASFDKQTVKRLKDIEHLAEDDKKTLFSMMDAFLRDAKTRKADAA
jgi:transcriptional regulator with XRE-family HTH domain